MEAGRDDLGVAAHLGHVVARVDLERGWVAGAVPMMDRLGEEALAAGADAEGFRRVVEHDGRAQR